MFVGPMFHFFVLPVKMTIRCLNPLVNHKCLGENIYIYTVWHLMGLLQIQFKVND